MGLSTAQGSQYRCTFIGFSVLLFDVGIKLAENCCNGIK
jgi:hypothetical protein